MIKLLRADERVCPRMPNNRHKANPVTGGPERQQLPGLAIRQKGSRQTLLVPDRQLEGAGTKSKDEAGCR